MEPSAGRRSFLLGLTGASAAAALTLAGCGSGGASGSSAKVKTCTAKITVVWPKDDSSSRYIQKDVTLIEAWAQTYDTTTKAWVNSGNPSPIQFTRTAGSQSDTESHTGYIYGITAGRIRIAAKAFKSVDTDDALGSAVSGEQTGAMGDTLIFAFALMANITDLYFTVEGFEPLEGFDKKTFEIPTSTTTTVTVHARNSSWQDIILPAGYTYGWENDDPAYAKITPAANTFDPTATLAVGDTISPISGLEVNVYIYDEKGELYSIDVFNPIIVQGYGTITYTFNDQTVAEGASGYDSDLVNRLTPPASWSRTPTTGKGTGKAYTDNTYATEADAKVTSGKTTYLTTGEWTIAFQELTGYITPTSTSLTDGKIQVTTKIAVVETLTYVAANGGVNAEVVIS